MSHFRTRFNRFWNRKGIVLHHFTVLFCIATDFNSVKFHFYHYQFGRFHGNILKHKTPNLVWQFSSILLVFWGVCSARKILSLFWDGWYEEIVSDYGSRSPEIELSGCRLIIRTSSVIRLRLPRNNIKVPSHLRFNYCELLRKLFSIHNRKTMSTQSIIEFFSSCKS